MKSIFRYGLLSATFITFFCGIYRHDVDKQAYRNLAMQPQFDCVGQVFKNGKSHGTAELINKRYVLSAAHVFI